MKEELLNTGFIEPVIIEPEEFVFGGGLLNDTVLQRDGDWSRYIPREELQLGSFGDTYNCSGFGTLNAIEILGNRKYAKRLNYSDRALGIAAGTWPPGNDPHKVAEIVRKVGLVPEEILPFDESCVSLETYYSPKPLTKYLLEVAAKFLGEFRFGHEWVWNDPKLAIKEKQKLLMNALKFSPLGVSVLGWRKDRGYYVKDRGESDNHWVALIGYKEGDWWEVFDHVPPFRKKLAWDYDFRFAKRYSLEELDVEGGKKNIIGIIIEHIFEFIGLKQKEMDTQTPSQKLYEVAVAALGQDVTPHDEVPDNVACAQSVSALIKRVYKDFPRIDGTWSMLDYFTKHTKMFERLSGPEQGALIICATGTGGANGVLNGHVGIVGRDGVIMSNHSPNGKWIENFTLASWRERYETRGKFKTHYFKLI